MNKWVGEAHEIIAARGTNITQADVEEIHLLLSHIDFADDQGQLEAAWVMEGLWRIVNDPRYNGDADPLD